MNDGLGYFGGNSGGGGSNSPRKAARMVEPAKFSDEVVRHLRNEGTASQGVWLRTWGARLKKGGGRNKKKSYEQNQQLYLGVISWMPQVNPPTPNGMMPDQYGDASQGMAQHPWYITEYLSDPDVQSTIQHWDGESPIYIEAFCPVAQEVISKTVVILGDEDDEAANGAPSSQHPSVNPLERALYDVQNTLAERVAHQLTQQVVGGPPAHPGFPGFPQGQGHSNTHPGFPGGPQMVQLENGTWAPMDYVIRQYTTSQKEADTLRRQVEKIEKKLEEKKEEPSVAMEILRESSPQIIGMLLSRVMGGPQMPPGMMMPPMGGMMPGTAGGPPMGMGGGGNPMQGLMSMMGSLGIDPSIVKNVMGSFFGGGGPDEDDDEDYEDDEDDAPPPPKSGPRVHRTTGAGSVGSVGDLLHGTVRQPVEVGRSAAGRPVAPNNADYHSGLANIDPRALRPSGVGPGVGAGAGVGRFTSPGVMSTPGTSELDPRDEPAVAKIRPFACKMFEALYSDDPNTNLDRVIEQGIRLAPSFAKEAGASTFFWLKKAAADPDRMAKWMATVIARDYPGMTDGWGEMLPAVLSSVIERVTWD